MRLPSSLTRLDGTIHYLRRSDVVAALREVEPTAIIRDALIMHGTDEADVPLEASVRWRGRRMLNMPGRLGNPPRLVGTKIINANPANIRAGLPRANGVIVLADIESARIEWVIEATLISALRTAAVSAVSVSALSAAPSVRLSLIGAGMQARVHLGLFLETFGSIEEVHLFDVERASADALEREYERVLRERSIPCIVHDDAEGAVRAGNVVVTLTTVTEGYIPFEWLAPGTVIVNVSLDDPLPDVFVRATYLLVDDVRLVVGDEQRILGKLVRAGAVGRPGEAGAQRMIDAEIGAYLRDLPWRPGAHDIVLVNPFGLSIEDLALADAIVRIARRDGLGITLDL